MMSGSGHETNVHGRIVNIVSPASPFTHEGAGWRDYCQHSIAIGKGSMHTMFIEIEICLDLLIVDPVPYFYDRPLEDAKKQGEISRRGRP